MTAGGAERFVPFRHPPPPACPGGHPGDQDQSSTATGPADKPTGPADKPTGPADKPTVDGAAESRPRADASTGHHLVRSSRTETTIAETLRTGATRLAGAGIDNPRLEARLLLAHALGRAAEDLIRDLTAAAAPSGFDRLIARRATGEPLAYILGWREFWSLRFRVSPATLIPRPDSETLVEAALALWPDRLAPIRVLDLGTGTGCLLLAFLHERPGAFGVGVDRFEPAALLAGRNAHDLRLAGRSAFLCGDWAGAIGGRFDLVLSNPPYIATPDLATLDVATHEPRAALDGGEYGLAAYRDIIAALPGLLAPSGAAVLELGAGQFDAVAAIAGAAGYRANARPDLSGIPRAMILRPPP